MLLVDKHSNSFVQNFRKWDEKVSWHWHQVCKWHRRTWWKQCPLCQPRLEVDQVLVEHILALSHSTCQWLMPEAFSLCPVVNFIKLFSLLTFKKEKDLESNKHFQPGKGKSMYTFSAEHMRISAFRSPACWLYPLKPGGEQKSAYVWLFQPSLMFGCKIRAYPPSLLASK